MEVRDFQKEVVKESHKQPVLVDFWAPWCQPCRILSPVLDKLAQQAGSKWRLAKVNTDEHPELAQAWNIQGIPAVKLFHQGEVIAEFVGALPEREIASWLENHLPSAAKLTLQAAQAALAKGEASTAKKLLQQVLKHEPQNIEARVLLAEQAFLAERKIPAELLPEVEESHPLYDHVNALHTLQRLLNMPLEPGAAQDEKLYIQGITALRQGKFASSLEAWIEVMQMNRSLDDDGARKACVALFTVLGAEHELTQKYRRPFSSALY